MDPKIIFDKDGIVIHIKSQSMVWDGNAIEQIIIYTTIEQGAFRSVSYAGPENEMATSEYLNFLLMVVKNHYADKGKIRTAYRSDGNGGMQEIKKIYEFRDGKWNWFDV